MVGPPPALPGLLGATLEPALGRALWQGERRFVSAVGAGLAEDALSTGSGATRAGRGENQGSRQLTLLLVPRGGPEGAELSVAASLTPLHTHQMDKQTGREGSPWKGASSAPPDPPRPNGDPPVSSPDLQALRSPTPDLATSPE